EVVGVLAGGVEADDEVDGAGAGALGDALEPLSEESVSGGGLGEGQFGGGGLEGVGEAGRVVAVAGRVDADAAASGRWRGGGGLWEHGGLGEGGEGGGRGGGGGGAAGAWSR